MVAPLLAFGDYRFIGIIGQSHEVAVVVTCLYRNVGLLAVTAVIRIIACICIGCCQRVAVQDIGTVTAVQNLPCIVFPHIIDIATCFNHIVIVFVVGEEIFVVIFERVGNGVDVEVRSADRKLLVFLCSHPFAVLLDVAF